MAKQNRKYRNKVYMAVFSLLTAILAVGAATFAWYIYDTSAHTTNVRFVAGTSSSLLIADTYDGTYGYTASVDPCIGALDNVSTDLIQGGFQKVKDYIYEDENRKQETKIAVSFRKAEPTDYYKRTLYLKATNLDTKVYVKNIGFTDTDKDNPMSTSIRVGLVVHKPGEDKDDSDIENEYIFDINPDQHVSNPRYNTLNGKEGEVLDHTKTDGSTIKFTPLTTKNYCQVSGNNEVSVTDYSQQIGTCPGGGEPVKVDMYIWLEGCDKDCVGVIGTLSEITIEFAGFFEEN